MQMATTEAPAVEAGIGVKKVLVAGGVAAAGLIALGAFLRQERNARRAERLATARLYAKEGLMQYRDRNLEASLDAFNHAIELDGTIAKYYTRRAFVLLQMGRSKEALKDGQTSVELDPSAQSYYIRGRAALHCKLYQQAASDFDKVVLDETADESVVKAAQLLRLTCDTEIVAASSPAKLPRSLSTGSRQPFSNTSEDPFEASAPIKSSRRRDDPQFYMDSVFTPDKNALYRNQNLVITVTTNQTPRFSENGNYVQAATAAQKLYAAALGMAVAPDIVTPTDQRLPAAGPLESRTPMEAPPSTYPSNSNAHLYGRDSHVFNGPVDAHRLPTDSHVYGARTDGHVFGGANSHGLSSGGHVFGGPVDSHGINPHGISTGGHVFGGAVDSHGINAHGIPAGGHVFGGSADSYGINAHGVPAAGHIFGGAVDSHGVNAHGIRSGSHVFRETDSHGLNTHGVPAAGHLFGGAVDSHAINAHGIGASGHIFGTDAHGVNSHGISAGSHVFGANAHGAPNSHGYGGHVFGGALDAHTVGAGHVYDASAATRNPRGQIFDAHAFPVDQFAARDAHSINATNVFGSSAPANQQLGEKDEPDRPSSSYVRPAGPSNRSEQSFRSGAPDMHHLPPAPMGHQGFDAHTVSGQVYAGNTHIPDASVGNRFGPAGPRSGCGHSAPNPFLAAFSANSGQSGHFVPSGNPAGSHTYPPAGPGSNQLAARSHSSPVPEDDGSRSLRLAAAMFPAPNVNPIPATEAEMGLPKGAAAFVGLPKQVEYPVIYEKVVGDGSAPRPVPGTSLMKASPPMPESKPREQAIIEKERDQSVRAQQQQAIDDQARRQEQLKQQRQQRQVQDQQAAAVLSQPPAEEKAQLAEQTVASSEVAPSTAAATSSSGSIVPLPTSSPSDGSASTSATDSPAPSSGSSQNS